MALANKRFTRLYIGKEATPGTPVAFTRRLTGEGNADFNTNQTQFQWDDSWGAGVRTQRVQTPLNIGRGTVCTFRAPFDFDNVLLALLSGFHGGITPTEPDPVAAPGNRLWDFNLVPRDRAGQETYTFLYGETDDTSRTVFRSDYMFCREFTITASSQQIAQMDMTFEGRAAAEYTPSVPNLEVHTNRAVGSWGFGINISGSWADMIAEDGQSDTASNVDNIRYTMSGQWQPIFTLSDIGQESFSAAQLDTASAQISFDVLIDPVTGSTARGEYRASTLGQRRFVEFKGFRGSGADQREVHLFGCFVHDPDSMTQRGPDRDGIPTLRASMTSVYDPTSANDVRAQVRNRLPSYP